MKIDFKYYFKNLFKLALPILAGNIGQVLINLGDIYVAGHYNTNALAAISVASAIFMTYIVAGFGLIGAIAPVLSNYRGKRISTKKYLFPTILFSQAMGFVFFLSIWLFLPLVYKFGLNNLILNDCILYLKISSFSIFGIFLFSALREYLQAHEIVKFPNTVIIISVFINLFLNYIFTFGYGIIPEFGACGLAYASLITRTLTGLTLLLFCLNFKFKKQKNDIKFYIKDLLKTGFPISCAMFIEFLGFNIVAVLTGKLDPIYTACHNIIITITSIVYMIPFSISSALSVKIGYANGKDDLLEIKNYLISSFVFLILYSTIIVSFLLGFRKEIMEIFTLDKKVIEVGISIMMLVSCFNIFDGVQSVCIGALKGMKKTLQVMIVDFTGYIIISTPLGLYFAYISNMNLYGFWLGLAFGIFTAAIVSFCLFIRIFNMRRKNLSTQITM